MTATHEATLEPRAHPLNKGGAVEIGRGNPDGAQGYPSIGAYEVVGRISLGNETAIVKSGELPGLQDIYLLHAGDSGDPDYHDLASRAEREGVEPTPYVLAVMDPADGMSVSAMAFVPREGKTLGQSGIVGRKPKFEAGGVRWFGFGVSENGGGPLSKTPFESNHSIDPNQFSIQVTDADRVLIRGLAEYSRTSIEAPDLTVKSEGEAKATNHYAEAATAQRGLRHLVSRIGGKALKRSGVRR